MVILKLFLFVHYVSITLDSDMKSRVREMSNRGHCYTADKILNIVPENITRTVI